MSIMTQKEFDQLFGELIKRIQNNATPFPNDSSEKKRARIARAKVDKLFFACTYFPHYLVIENYLRECWKNPDGTYDYVNGGFATFHPELIYLSDIMQKLTIVAGFRESAKDTLIRIDTVHKLVFGDRWFIPLIAKTETKAEAKVAPVKIELEENIRLKNDFGDLRGTREWEYGSFITSTGRKMKGYGRDQSLVGEEHDSHRPDFLQINDINDPFIPDSIDVVKTVVERLKNSVLYAVNSVRWSGIMVCNWVVKGDIVDEMMTGKNTSHFNKVIYRALIDNPQETREQKKIAKECRDAGFPDDKMSAWHYRHNTMKLLHDRKNDPETFNAQMLQIPRNRRDQKFKDNYFKYHTKEDLRGREYTFYTAVDPSATEANDKKVVITIGLGLTTKGNLHMPVMKADIKQESIDWMLETSWRHHQLFTMKILGVEENAYKDFVRREYMRLMTKHRTPLPFFPLQHSKSKQMRIERIVPFVKEGIITFDLDDPDQDELIQQLKLFPNGGSVSSGGLGDDAADCLAMCVELIERFPHAGEVVYESVREHEAIFEEGTW